MNTVQGFVDQFGPVVGPKLLHLERSRAAYKGVSTRRRRVIETITGEPFRRPAPRIRRDDPLPLFPNHAPSAAGPNELG